MNRQLLKKIVIKGKIKAKSGLRIGGSGSALEIGGVDLPIIRNPIDNKPYLPGSSIKGKMRSLLELNQATIGVVPMSNTVKNGPSMDPKSWSAKLFGNALSGKDEKAYGVSQDQQRPSRVIVRDANLTEKSAKELEKGSQTPYSEVKTEVVIDRITSAAMPRQLERVPAGAEFELEIVLNIFRDGGVEDEEKKYMDYLFLCLQLLRDDYLGGHGSRGSGQVAFDIDQIWAKDTDTYLTGDKGKDLKEQYAKQIENLKN